MVASHVRQQQSRKKWMRFLLDTQQPSRDVAQQLRNEQPRKKNAWTTAELSSAKRYIPQLSSQSSRHYAVALQKLNPAFEHIHTSTALSKKLLSRYIFVFVRFSLLCFFCHVHSHPREYSDWQNEKETTPHRMGEEKTRQQQVEMGWPPSMCILVQKHDSVFCVFNSSWTQPKKSRHASKWEMWGRWSSLSFRLSWKTPQLAALTEILKVIFCNHYIDSLTQSRLEKHKFAIRVRGSKVKKKKR